MYKLRNLFEELTPNVKQAAVKSYSPGKGYDVYCKDGALDKLARKYFKMYTDTGTVVTNFVLMPTIKKGGKGHDIFNVGKPKKQKLER